MCGCAENTARDSNIGELSIAMEHGNDSILENFRTRQQNKVKIRNLGKVFKTY